MAFTGWKAEALEFFEGLEVENTKAYWERNRQTYDTLVKAPMEELLAELEPKWGEGRIFRPYRDVRFSKNKSPYKTNIAAVVGGSGYVHLDSKGLSAGSGMWEMAPDQLERYRNAVVNDRSGKALVEVVSKGRAQGIDVMSHGELKTAPRGYPKDHPRVEFLRYKGLAVWKEWPAGAWLGTKKAKERLEEFLTAAKPLNAWLTKNVGPSELPSERRR
jgi:uncharacterized protein (TIGR02453 family)